VVTGDMASGKGASTRRRILTCAVARLANDGFRQTSVAQVARDAGVTAQAVHAHFGSKQALFHAAFEHDVEDLLEVVTARFAAGAEPGAPLNLMRALLGEVDAHPLARRVLQGHEADRTRELLDLPAFTRAREELTRLVTDAQQGGMLRDDLAPAALAGALETLILALLLGAVQVGMIGDDQRRLAVTAILIQGIRPA
jgi:AcrR family transcriptional regulator